MTTSETLTRGELAERWAMSTHTLARWAFQGVGPRPLYFGRRAVYLLKDVRAYEAEKLAQAEARREAAAK